MRKTPLYIVAGLIVAGILVFAALPFFIDANQYRPSIQAQLEAKLKRTVTLGNLTLNRFPLSIEARDVVIGEDPSVGSATRFAAAKSILVKPSFAALLRAKFEASSLVLDNPALEIIRKKDGTWNFSSLGHGTGGEPFSIDDLEIRDGTLAISDLETNRPREVYSGIDIHLRDFAAGKTYKLSAAARLPPGRLAFEGTGEGFHAATGKVVLKDVQISSLVKFLNTDAVAVLEKFEGILNGSAVVDLNRGKFSVKGEIAAEKVKAGQHAVDFPLALNFDLSQDRATNLLHIAAAEARLGGNSFSISGEVDRASTPPVLHLKANQLKGSLTEAAHLAALSGLAFTPGLIVKGDLDGNLSIDGPSTYPALNGHLGIAGFEASSKGWKQPVKSPVVRLDFDPGGVRAAPMTLVCGTSHLEVSGSITDYTKDQPRIAASIKSTGASLDELLNIAAALGFTATSGITGQGKASVDLLASGAAKNPKLNGLISLDAATLNLPSVSKPLTVAHLNMTWSGDTAAIDNLTASIGSSNLTGNLTLKNFASPHVTFAVNADKLDMGQFTTTTQTRGPSKFEKVIAHGSLTAGQIISNGLVLTKVKAQLTLEHGVAKLSPLTAGLFEGTVRGSIETDLRPAIPAFRTTLTMSQVDTNALLSATTPLKQTLYGKLDTDGSVSFVGTTEQSFTKSLNGPLNLKLSSGRLMGVNILNEVAKAARFLGFHGDGKPYTTISALNGALTFENGIAQSSDLLLEADGAIVTGAGTINLVDQGLDLRLIATLTKDLLDREGGNRIGGLMVTALSGADGSIVVPVRVGGTFAQPRVTPDAEKFAEIKLKNTLEHPVDAVKGVFDKLTKRKPDGKQ